MCLAFDCANGASIRREREREKKEEGLFLLSNTYQRRAASPVQYPQRFFFFLPSYSFPLALVEQKVAMCKECIEWAKENKRQFLRQALEVRVLCCK